MITTLSGEWPARPSLCIRVSDWNDSIGKEQRKRKDRVKS